MYEKVILPIDSGTEVLTPEFSYFLGAILSTNESYCEEHRRFWLAPIRHNAQQVSDDKIELHQKFIKKNIGRLNSRVYSKNTLVKKGWFPTNKVGFAAVFESPEETNLESLIAPVVNALDKSSLDVLRAFIVGAFDGRSSLDINLRTRQIRYLSLDVGNEMVASYLIQLLGKFELRFNYNQARDRIEGGSPRKAQLRIHGNYLPTYLETIGFISPFKFEQIQSLLNPLLKIHYNDDILIGLKTLSNTHQQNNPFPYISIETQEIEDIEDEELLNCINNNVLQIESKFIYSGIPKVKAITSLIKGKMIYKRDKKVAVNALSLANYNCEINDTHPSFIRKNSNISYSEPHHFIPMAFQEMFGVSLDIEENIVSLCSNCHNQLHYGKNIDQLLVYLYEKRKEMLKKVGINVSLSELFKMYNA